MELLWDRGTKVCSNSPGHKTRMAAMPISGINLKNFSLEPKGRLPWILVCSIGCSSSTNFVQIMTLGWPWPILRQGQLWSLMLLHGKKVNNGFFFSETFVAYDVKVGRCSNLNDYMKLYEYQSQGHSLTLVQGHSDSKHFQSSFPWNR